MLKELFAWCSSILTSGREQHACPARTPHKVGLCLETLEERWTPASLTWNGPNGGAWSVAANWKDDSTGQAPDKGAQPNDSLTFDGAVKDTNSEADVVDVKDLTIKSNYTKEIKIVPGMMQVSNLKVTGTLAMGGGSIWGGGLINTLEVPNNTSVFTWTGGSLKTLTLKLGTGTNRPTATISGTADKVLDGFAALRNNGTITWTDTGNIKLQNVGSVTNQSGATFDIQTNASITQDSACSFTNDAAGTVKKSAGNGTTTIEANFTNNGSFQLQSGAVKFTKPASQSNASALTRLSGGNLEAADGYSLNAGTLDGVGTVTGNLAVGTASVRPGLNGTPGNIIVTGNYTVNGGALVIDISAAGVYGTLTVQGSATLSGSLIVNRNAAYTPSELGLELTFLSYASVSGNFSSFSLGDPWVNGGDYRRFDVSKNATDYRLVVAADD